MFTTTEVTYIVICQISVRYFTTGMDYFIYPDSLILAMHRLPYCVNTDTLEISFNILLLILTLKHTTSLPLI